VKGNPQKYFAQVFQALRIEVNDELGDVKRIVATNSFCTKNPAVGLPSSHFILWKTGW
jgi:16S rRNA C1402 N4-methylase RsmH